MKRLKSYSIIRNLLCLGVIGAFTSCDNFLDSVPLTNESEDTYFENENRVERGIGGIYSEVGVLYNPNFGTQLLGDSPLFGITLLPGDDITVNNGQNTNFESFRVQIDDIQVKNYWSILFAIVSRANFMLEKLDDPAVQAVCTTKGYVNWCKGECHFLRAFADMRLWDGWRKAPNQTQRIGTIEETSLPPSHGFELLDQAISDLQIAESLLPDSWEAKNKGRAFKNSARGMLVKCYMLRANYADQYEGGNRAQDYQNAINAFERIDGESTIEGVPFGSNFDYRTENNKESLFEYQAGHNPQKEDNPWLNQNFGGGSGSVGTYYGYYWENHYRIKSIFGPTHKLINAFEAGDPRKDETVTTDFMWAANWGSFDGYQFIKYINGDRRGDLDNKYRATSPNNPRILRLADVKLMAAEAYLQTGNNEAALTQVNDVRRRARFSTPSGSEAAAPADYSTIDMQKIMDERFVELAGEDGVRFCDLKRWHAAGFINLAEWAQDPETNFGTNVAVQGEGTFDFKVPRNLLWPIPYQEMTRNQLMFAEGNNPGY